MLKTVFLSTRPPFLILSLICVFLGISIVAREAVVNVHYAVLAVIGGLSAHMSVNLFNEYYDFKSGLDFNTIKTPFSGGSGALPNNPQFSKAVLLAAISTTTITSLIGLYFINIYGLGLLPLGILGLFLVLTYNWINRWPLLCLIAPGLGFGFAMVVGTQYVLTGEYWGQAVYIGLITFFLVNNLLLLNQYPDLTADKAVGRNHVPIAYGLNVSTIVYSFFALAALLILLLLVLEKILPIASLFALLPFALTGIAALGAYKYKDTIGAHPQFLAANVASALIVPAIIMISLFLA